jgi:crotonobetainyl-CoA:carnitine CoA-transferase CaiB-like acyl-CoA transferase
VGSSVDDRLSHGEVEIGTSVTAAGVVPRPLPLAGITVVSVEQAVAAPLATRHLADLGARVVKVERLDGGDFARAYDTAVNGLASHFVWLNRSKESVGLDLKTAAGRKVLGRLVAGADVFVQNLAPGAADRLGFGADVLHARHPRLVVVSMTGYGESGPFRDHRAYDMLVQAEAGLISITGSPEAPAKTGIPSADIAAGMYAFSAVLAALLRRERDPAGGGGIVEVSMFDALVEWMGHPMYMSMYTGQQPSRMGLSHPAIAPYDAYPTRDGEVLIGVQNNTGWARLVEVLGRPELATHPRYATNIDRCRHRTEVDRTVAAATSRWDSDRLLAALVTAGVPAARLNDVAGMVAHPQLDARDRWTHVASEAGEVRAVLPPIGLRDAAPRMDPVPALGEHTDTVLAELGYSTGDIAELRRTRVVG